MYETTSSAAATQNLNAAMSLSMALLSAIIVSLILIVPLWKIFTKAGQEGWKSIIPIYNIFVLLKISGTSGWWLLAFLASPIPLVGFISIVASLILALNLAKVFGRSSIFGVIGLFIFSIVGYFILAFGKDQYVGPGGSAAAPVPAAPTPPVAPTPPAATPAA